MNTSFCYVIVPGKPDGDNYLTYLGPNFHEMQFTNREKAKKYAPSTGVRVVECTFAAVDSGRPLPKYLLTAQAIFEDGSVVPGCPAPRFTAPARPKVAQIPTLPEVPPFVKLSDGRWVVVPQMDTKYSSQGQYFAVPYSFLYRRSPVHGYFQGLTKQDVFDAIFNTKNDAVSDGRGGWLNPQNPQVPGEPTVEQIYRTTQLPVADATEVQNWLNLVAQRDAAIAAAEIERYREPTEAEIQAVDVCPEVLSRMTAQEYKAKYLSDRAFRAGVDRQEAFEKAIREKERREREEAERRQEIDHGLKVLADREKGITLER